MQLRLHRHLWGLDEPWETALAGLRAKGYCGVFWLADAGAQAGRLCGLLERHQLDYVPVILTAGQDVREHVESFRRQYELGRRWAPELMNCNGGRDDWSANETDQFMREVLAIEADAGIAVAHETHRGRVLYAPWATRRLLERWPDLKLCCDLSHWVCVCERLLEDQEDVIGLCAGRCIQVHARVGHEEGPQVPDPRVPAYARHAAAHERWWDQIWEARAAAGAAWLSVVPEYGPPPYLQTGLHSGKPVADLAEICDWAAGRWRRRLAHEENRGGDRG